MDAHELRRSTELASISFAVTLEFLQTSHICKGIEYAAVRPRAHPARAGASSTMISRNQVWFDNRP